MKKREFEQIKNELLDGLCVVVRYFTYNKNHYVDILGTVSSSLYPIGYDEYDKTYKFTILFDRIIDYYGDFNEYTYPVLNTFWFKDSQYMHIFSNKILFVKKASLRSYKLNKIKEKING